MGYAGAKRQIGKTDSNDRRKKRARGGNTSLLSPVRWRRTGAVGRLASATAPHRPLYRRNRVEVRVERGDPLRWVVADFRPRQRFRSRHDAVGVGELAQIALQVGRGQRAF